MDITSTTETIKNSPGRGRIYTSFPKMWVLLVLGFICLTSQMLNSYLGMLMASMAGTCYWWFCVYRIHKVLAEYTAKRYPISPSKAVGFQFIPLFLYYWSFRWIRQIAGFVAEESGGKHTVARVWPALLLVIASLVGLFERMKTVRLMIIFAVGVYLTRKLQAVLPACKPLSFKRFQQWKLSMAAGIGAAFSLILFQAVRRFEMGQFEEKLYEMISIFIVSIGVLIFLEPVFEKIRSALGLEEHHPVMHRSRPFHVRFIVLAILVLTSLSHGLVHSEVETAIRNDPARMIAMLLSSFLLAGGITYFWINASHRVPSRAARSGILSGAILGFLVALVVSSFSAAPERLPEAAEKTGQSYVEEKMVQSLLPWIPPALEKDIRQGHGSATRQIGVIMLPWVIFGFFGGIAIDRRWRNGSSSGVALSIISAGAVTGMILFAIKQFSSIPDVLGSISVVVGWALALWVGSTPEILMPKPEQEAVTSLEPETARVPLGVAASSPH